MRHLTSKRLLIFALALILLSSLAAVGQRKRFSSRYVKPESDGLFYTKGPGKYDRDALVLSSSNKPIEQKANDPDAPTIPGYYRTDTPKRLDFESVEIIGKRVYSKTRSAGEINYEFRGVIGRRIIPEFSDTVLVPFIKGKLTKRKNGKIVRIQKVTFGHAVIA